MKEWHGERGGRVAGIIKSRGLREERKRQRRNFVANDEMLYFYQLDRNLERFYVEDFYNR